MLSVCTTPEHKSRYSLGNATAVAVNSSYFIARENCRDLKIRIAVLSQRAVNKVVLPISPGKKCCLAGAQIHPKPILNFSWKCWNHSLIIKWHSMFVQSANPRTRHQSFQGDRWVSWSKKLKHSYLHALHCSLWLPIESGERKPLADVGCRCQHRRGHTEPSCMFSQQLSHCTLRYCCANEVIS